ncbi:DNA helicase UvrD [Candidatus Woesearchaeota archaeon]|nr:DNA helicase UvrD [Candidatus Woesearchaeota archaeon]
MRFICDFHIHSRHSRATSKDLTIPNLEKYARMKGVSILGTGDFQHPKWNAEIKEHLTQGDDGLLRTKSGYPFLLQTEISLVYTQSGKGRRVHNLVLAPSIEVADQIAEALLKRGRIDYDGRPIFKIPCPEFVEMLRNISPEIEVIPAHAWTPWFSMFGSMSGFDTIKDCFQDQTKHIHAIETGLSSDPEMNWRLSQLDNINLVSFSDLHSFWPWRIGREATILELNKPSYSTIVNAFRTGQGLTSTIEFFPEEGKYHVDGHRNCNIMWSPAETRANKGICPTCKSPVTVGVLNRVEQLADRAEGEKPKNAKKYIKLIPLSELVSHAIGSPVASKKTWAEYTKLINLFGTEFAIMLDAPAEKLKASTTTEIAALILAVREQKIQFRPGYDGVYGEPLFHKPTHPAQDEVAEREREAEQAPTTSTPTHEELRDRQRPQTEMPDKPQRPVAAKHSKTTHGVTQAGLDNWY